MMFDGRDRQREALRTDAWRESGELGRALNEDRAYEV